MVHRDVFLPREQLASASEDGLVRWQTPRSASCGSGARPQSAEWQRTGLLRLQRQSDGWLLRRIAAYLPGETHEEGRSPALHAEINKLQHERKPGDKELLSAEQRELLKSFRKKEVEAKKALQTARKQLRKDVDSLENRVMLVNIGLMPLLVAIGGLAYAFLRRRS